MKRQNKLGTYLAVTAGVGCVSSAANAQTVVLPGDSGLGIVNLVFDVIGNDRSIQGNGEIFSSAVNGFYADYEGSFFFRGTENPTLDYTYMANRVQFHPNFLSIFSNGAEGGTDNFASLVTLIDGETIQSIVQFNFDPVLEGMNAVDFVVASATNVDGSTLSISDEVCQSLLVSLFLVLARWGSQLVVAAKNQHRQMLS